MAKLLSRQKFIPGGFLFFQPEIKWQSPRMASFETIVNGLIAARRANPVQSNKYRWPIDHDTVADEVDAFNARVCEMNGWNDYISGGADTGPFTQALSGRSKLPPVARNVVAGAKTLAEMLGVEGAVDHELAEARAKVCAPCPMNEKGDWTRFFTVPASNAIKAMIGILNGQHLETSVDAELRVCTACGCPCRTKVHARLSHILKHMPAESFDALAPDCWIRRERL